MCAICIRLCNLGYNYTKAFKDYRDQLGIGNTSWGMGGFGGGKRKEEMS